MFTMRSKRPTAISLVIPAALSGTAPLSHSQKAHACAKMWLLLTYLLLRILHPAHAHLAPPLHAHWISMWRRRSVRLAGRVRSGPWLLWGGVGVVGHAIQLRTLHGHEVHGGHLWRENRD